MSTPVVALLLRKRAGRSVGRHRREPPPDGAWAAGSPDWAGRHPYSRRSVPSPTTDTDHLCLASMITGIGAIGFVLLCAFFSVPLAIVALITGVFGLTGARDEPSSNRRMAVAGISCGGATVLILSLIIILFVL